MPLLSYHKLESATAVRINLGGGVEGARHNAHVNCPHHCCASRQRCWLLVGKLLLIVWRIDRCLPRSRVLLVEVTSRAGLLWLVRPVGLVKLVWLLVQSGWLGLKRYLGWWRIL